jgi:hypothetical protein
VEHTIPECLQYELCMGKHPFTAQNEGALIRKILRGTYPPPSGYSAALLDLIRTCLKFDQSKRPNTSALLARPDLVAKARALGIPLDQEILLRHAHAGTLSAQNTRSHQEDARAPCGVEVAQEALKQHSDVVQPAESHFSHPTPPPGHPFVAKFNSRAPATNALMHLAQPLTAEVVGCAHLHEPLPKRTLHSSPNDAKLQFARKYHAEDLAAMQQTAGLPYAPHQSHPFSVEAANAGAVRPAPTPSFCHAHCCRTCCVRCSKAMETRAARCHKTCNSACALNFGTVSAAWPRTGRAESGDWQLGRAPCTASGTGRHACQGARMHG